MDFSLPPILPSASVVNHSTSTLRSRRQILRWGASLTLTVPTVALFSGCSGPKREPNPALVDLRNRAEQLHHAAHGAGLVGLEAVSATQLRYVEEEIVRLCGHNKSGAIPASCESFNSPTDNSGREAPELPNVEVSAALRGYGAASLAAVEPKHADSGLLVGLYAGAQQWGAQYDLIPTTEVRDQRNQTYAEAAITAAHKEDAAALRDVLHQLYAAIYGFGLAIGLVGDGYRKNVVSAANKLRAAREAIVGALRSAEAEIPYPQGGYQFTTRPTDEASSLNLVIAQSEAISTACYQAAQKTETAPFVTLLAQISATSAIDAAYFKGRIGAPTLTAIPGLGLDYVAK